MENNAAANQEMISSPANLHHGALHRLIVSNMRLMPNLAFVQHVAMQFSREIVVADPWDFQMLQGVQ